jgi:hypothetical protein
LPNAQHHLSSTSIVQRSDGFVHAEVDNEVVALSIDRGTCYGLNPVGSRIWKIIENPVAIDDICSRLMAEYDVDAATCERQVLDLLEELRSEGLIKSLERK